MVDASYKSCLSYESSTLEEIVYSVQQKISDSPPPVEWQSVIDEFLAGMNSRLCDAFSRLASFLDQASSIPFSLLHNSPVPHIILDTMQSHAIFDDLPRLRSDIKSSRRRYRPSSILTDCLRCCLQLCGSPLCVESGFASKEAGDAFLRISHFFDDPAAVLALRSVASIFDHSDRAMLDFEEIDFTHHIWELFRISKESDVKYYAIQVLNRWMRCPAGTRRTYLAYLKAFGNVDRKAMGAISEGIYQFVNRSVDDAEFALKNKGLLFCAHQISYGNEESRHFAIQTAIRLLSLEVDYTLAESFVESIVWCPTRPWSLISPYCPEGCKDTVSLMLMLHDRFDGFPQYLLEKRKGPSLMERIAKGMANGLLASKMELFELVAFWIGHPDERFMLTFLEFYSIEAFLDDFEELGPGPVREAIMTGLSIILRQSCFLGTALIQGGLPDTLSRLCDDEVYGAQAQLLLDLSSS
jgi:hypothetical protein